MTFERSAISLICLFALSIIHCAIPADLRQSFTDTVDTGNSNQASHDIDYPTPDHSFPDLTITYLNERPQRNTAILNDSLTSGYTMTNNTRPEGEIEGAEIRMGQGSNWAALFLFVIVVMTIGGNVLVCLAVAFKRKLQNMFNFFLVSLALSDMMSATLVMPVSIIKAAVGRWKS